MSFTWSLGERKPTLGRRRVLYGLLSCGVACVWGVVGPGSSGLAGQPLAPPAGAGPKPQVLTLPDAVRWALLYNPTLAAQRQQYGIAASQIIIADTYPFNPVLENRIQAANGPISAGITNRVPLDHALLWEVEIRGQADYRRQMARAGLSRTDWEIALQEQQLAVRVLRAFFTVLYRQEKLQLLENTLRLNQQLAQDVRKLLALNTLRGADLILAETEIDLTRSFYDTGQTDLVAATYELRRALGTPDQPFSLRGSLLVQPLHWDRETLLEAAYQRRADLRVRQAAVAEADANLRLTVADRFGNPTAGPAYSYDPTRVNLIGVQLNIPLPVLNTHRGEIARRQAERARALADLRETETTIQTDVQAALARLEVAQRRAENFRTQVLPRLQQGVTGLEKLFAAGEPGVDVLRIIDVRRKLLQARSSYLDTLWEVAQARADLVAAVGEPAVNLGPCVPPAPGVRPRP